MNWPHIHLMINHVPVIGSVLAFALLGGGLLRRSQDIVRASLVVFVVVGLSAAAVMRTGEPAEEAIEGLPGVSESALEAHEESGEAAAIALQVLAVVALAGLLFFRSPRRMPTWFAVLVLLGAVTPIALTARAANLGGRIRHPEIASPSASTRATGVQEDERHQE